MMDIDTLSGAELDALAAAFMGWRESHTDESFPCWRNRDGDIEYLADDWAPTNKDSNTLLPVLLKALGEGLTVVQTYNTYTQLYSVSAFRGMRTAANSVAPTLPLALVRAICKAVAK